jgi:phage protein D
MLRQGAALPVDQPAVQVAVNGNLLPGVKSLEVESVGYFAADRYRIGFASAPLGVSYFAALGVAEISIDVAAAGAGYVTLLTGQVDNIHADLQRKSVVLSGRDLSARLIDTEISQTFANRTSSQIAASIAAAHQLTANVTATKTPVGQYYELDHARSALTAHARVTTAWSLLTWLAEMENFDLSVTGTVLNFGPPVMPAPIFLTPQDFTALNLDIATTVPARATVKSWNSRQKAVIAQTAGSAGGTSTTIIQPNLTPAQAIAMASTHLVGLARHTTILTAEMPGELSLMPASRIILGNTHSAFDQTYTVAVVTRSLSARRGFTQTIRAYAEAG